MRSRSLRHLVSLAKRLLPVGAPFDDTLSYVHAWNKLEYRPNLVEPRSLNELILASKRRFRGDMTLARRLTDKVEFKAWLRETPAWEHLVVPTVGVYDSVDEVRDLVFARNTILKPTHLSGYTILFEEDRPLDATELVKVGRWLRKDHYRRSREPNYKGLRKRLICEQLLRDESGNVPMDFKFFMIEARPLFVQVDLDRLDNHTRQFYSMDWRLLDIAHVYPRNPVAINRPAQLHAALDIATALAGGGGIPTVPDRSLPPARKRDQGGGDNLLPSRRFSTILASDGGLRAGTAGKGASRVLESGDPGVLCEHSEATAFCSNRPQRREVSTRTSVTSDHQTPGFRRAEGIDP